jgi:hypothetical protein
MDFLDRGFIITIIVLIVVLAVFIFLFMFAERLSRGGKAKSKADGRGKAKSTAQDGSAKALVILEEQEGCIEGAKFELSSDIEALVAKEVPKKQVVEGDKSASERSRMHNRRARMLEYYDTKYKGRAASFEMESFDMQDGSSAGSTLVVDGIEITREDVKKLVALHGLLGRKTQEE